MEREKMKYTALYKEKYNKNSATFETIIEAKNKKEAKKIWMEFDNTINYTIIEIIKI